MPTATASQLPRPSHPPARRRVAWTVVILLPLAIAVATLGVIIAGGRMALTRKANPLMDVGSGLIVIAATSALGVVLPSLLLNVTQARWMRVRTSSQVGTASDGLVPARACPAVAA